MRIISFMRISLIQPLRSEIGASTDSQLLVGSGLFPALNCTCIGQEAEQEPFHSFENYVSMSPCPHVPTISIPPHPSFRSHSLKMNTHFVVKGCQRAYFPSLSLVFLKHPKNVTPSERKKTEWRGGSPPLATPSAARM